MSSFVFAFPSPTGVLRLGRVTLALTPSASTAPQPSEEPVAPDDNAVEVNTSASEYRPYRLLNDDSNDVRCEAKVVAQVVRPYINLRGELLTILETKAGTRVGVKTGLSLIPGERARQSVQVLKDQDAVVEFFGHGRLAKQLYEKLEIDTATVIE